MSVINNDENKTFGVTFRTPVSNSKGTPHILEHSVLCGSDKFPIKVRPSLLLQYKLLCFFAGSWRAGYAMVPRLHR